MVEFAGWAMPVYYSSIVDEHLATRRSVGLFDISHMGRLRFDGPDAAAFLDRLLTRRVIGMEPGKIRYSLVTREDGVILDDVLVYHLQTPEGAPYYLLVVNASNRVKIVDWVQRQILPREQIGFTDPSEATAMIAIQGPQALSVSQRVLGVCDPAQLDYYTGQTCLISGESCIVSRTGYTGEDGCEWIVPAKLAAPIWEQLVTVAESQGGLPVGLGARDTLRLEAAMPLYGHELSESISPIQAGLSFAVNRKGRQFIGSDALTQLALNQASLPRRIGLRMEGKRIPREHFPVRSPDGKTIGEVTSGTFSPTLEQAIAMAYVSPQFAAAGTRLLVDIRGRGEPAQVVPLPFYSRTAK